MRHQVEFFRCDCKAPEHTLRFDMESCGAHDDIPLLYATVFLHQWKPWWKRVVPAMRYLLNMPPRGDGHFDAWLMPTEGDSIERLSGIVSDYGAELAAWKERNGVKP